MTKAQKIGLEIEPKLRAASEPEDRGERITRRAKSGDMHEEPVCFSVHKPRSKPVVKNYLDMITKRLSTMYNRLISQTQ